MSCQGGCIEGRSGPRQNSKMQYLIKTKKGEYATQDRDLGLAASWSTDESKAHVFTAERAKFWLARMNAYVPGHAMLVEVFTAAQ